MSTSGETVVAVQSLLTGLFSSRNELEKTIPKSSSFCSNDESKEKKKECTLNMVELQAFADKQTTKTAAKHKTGCSDLSMLEDSQGAKLYSKCLNTFNRQYKRILSPATFQLLPKQRQEWSNFFQKFDSCHALHSAIWSYSSHQKWKKKKRNRVGSNGGTLKSIRETFNFFYINSDARSKEFSHLIRSGIPPEHRGNMWWLCSGAMEKKLLANESEQYEVVLSHALMNPSEASVEIEKDLNRTFFSTDNFHAELNVTNNIHHLRRVLLAYSARNSEVGYCQSMNFIVALLLLHLDEESSYWVLCSLVEDIVPGYYSKRMCGSHTDQRVLKDLLKIKLPKLYDHLSIIGVHYEPLVLKWLVCLYINILPLETTLRIWDCLFYEGSESLLRIGLVIFQLYAEEIMKADDAMDVYEILQFCKFKSKKRQIVFNPEFRTIVSSAYQKPFLDGDFPREATVALREQHYVAVEEEMEYVHQRYRKMHTEEPESYHIKADQIEYDLLDDLEDFLSLEPDTTCNYQDQIVLNSLVEKNLFEERDREVIENYW